MKIVRTLRTAKDIREIIENDKRFVPVNNRIFDDLYIHKEIEFHPFHDDPAELKGKLSENNDKQFRMTELDLIVLIFLQLINYNKVTMYADEIADYLKCSKKALLNSMNKLQRMMGTVTTKLHHATQQREPEEHQVRLLSEKQYNAFEKNEKGKTVKRKMNEWYINFDTDWDFFRVKKEEKWKRTNFFFVTINDFDLLTNGYLTRSQFVVYLYLIRRDTRRDTVKTNRNFWMRNSTIAEDLHIKGYTSIEKYLDHLHGSGYIEVNHPNNFEMNLLKRVEPSREFKPIYNYRALDNCRKNLIEKADNETLQEVNLDKWEDPFDNVENDFH